MANHIKEMQLRNAAIITGMGLLFMAILAIFANFFVLEKFIVPEDAGTTANNILAHTSVFRLGISSFLIVAILDVIVAWALYILLKPVNKNLSLLMAWFRVVYAAIFVAVLNNLFTALHLLTSTNYLNVFGTNQTYAQVMLHLDAFNYGWNISLVVFDFHLIILGYLAFKSGYIPRFLGALLMITGFGLLIDNFGKIIFPNFTSVIGLITGWGELIFMIWLLWKGTKLSP